MGALRRKRYYCNHFSADKKKLPAPLAIFTMGGRRRGISENAVFHKNGPFRRSAGGVLGMAIRGMLFAFPAFQHFLIKGIIGSIPEQDPAGNHTKNR